MILLRISIATPQALAFSVIFDTRNLVYKDTKFRVSKMTENANAWGVAMLIRNKIIGL